jgi:Fructose-1-6-bisphosphatase, N-terminal domain
MTNLQALLFALAMLGSFNVDIDAFHVGGPYRVITQRTIPPTSGRVSFASIQIAMADGAPQVPRPRKKNLKTFQRYLEIECWKRAEVRDLEKVLQAVAESCKQINRIVQRAQTDDLYGAAVGKDGEVLDANIQGEVQQQLDVLCNTIMLRAFCGSSRSIHSVASEEEDETRCCSDVMVRRVGVLGLCM